MKPTTKHPPLHQEHATLRLTLDVERLPGERLATIVEELRRATGDDVTITGLGFEPVAFELAGPRAALEGLRTLVAQDGLRRVLGTWRSTVGPVSRAPRPATRRGRQVLLVDGDQGRARADAEVLARAQIDTCVVAGIEAAQVMMQRAALPFDAVVLHHRLADGEGLELLDRVGLPQRCCSVLVIDDRARPELARAYRMRGVFRYAAPPKGPLQLISRVNATMLDTQAWRQAEDPGAEEPDEPPRQLVDPEQAADRLQHVCGLSPLERDVAVMVLLGLRDLDIADKLNQSERTAKRHVGKVLEKAGIGNRASLWGVLHADGLGTTPPRTTEQPAPAQAQAQAPLSRPVPPSSPMRPVAPPASQPSWPTA
jgi:DNA-binding NarL/FixJ family response regulator